MGKPIQLFSKVISGEFSEVWVTRDSGRVSVVEWRGSVNLHMCEIWALWKFGLEFDCIGARKPRYLVRYWLEHDYFAIVWNKNRSIAMRKLWYFKKWIIYWYWVFTAYCLRFLNKIGLAKTEKGCRYSWRDIFRRSEDDSES